MPYRFEREHWHIPKQYDRRTKLTDGQRQEIQQLYTNGTISIGGLARAYNVNKRLIQFILFPERHERNKQLRAERGGSKRYYVPEKNRQAISTCRKYKNMIYKKTKGTKNEM